MPYVGRDLQRGNYLKLDDISSSFDGSTTTFNLTSGGNAFFPGSSFSLIVSLGGVVQEPESAFQIDKSQIIFAQAPTPNDDFFCIVQGVALGVGVPGHNTVGNDHLTKPISYGDYFRWDSTNNRVGINTLSPSVALDVVGDASFSGNVAIGGTLTYEDVANIDAVGLITARAGIEDKTLTQGRVVFVGTNGRLVDNSNFTYNGTSLVSPQIAIGSALTFDGSKLTLAANSTAYDAFQIGSGLFIGNTTNNVNAAIFHQGGGADLEIGSQNAITFTTGSTAGNATEKVRITSAGRVGIGSAVPDGLLTIQGNSDATTTPSIRLKDGTDTREVSISNSAGDFVVSTHGTDNVQHGFIKLFESGLFTVATGGTGERLRIDTNGRLSLGVQASPGSYPTATVARQVQAEFKGSIDTSNNKHDGSLALNCTNNNANLHIIRSQNNQTSGVTLGNVNFTGFDGTDYHVAAQIAGVRDAAGGNNDIPGRLVFLTTADGAASPIEKLRITSTGLLQGTSYQHDGGLELLSGNNNQSTRLRLQSKSSGGTAYNWYLDSARSADRFTIHDGSTSWLTILGTGEVGINDTSPDRQFHRRRRHRHQ